MMRFEQFKTNVEAWAEERGIYKHSSVHAQVLKAVSEMGELADATIKNNDGDFQDAIGDVIVCLINAAKMQGVDFGECCAQAWNEIKDRNGRMVAGGAFVKDG